jgi:hypothetical protein
MLLQAPIKADISSIAACLETNGKTEKRMSVPPVLPLV